LSGFVKETTKIETTTIAIDAINKIRTFLKTERLEIGIDWGWLIFFDLNYK